MWWNMPSFVLRFLKRPDSPRCQQTHKVPSLPLHPRVAMFSFDFFRNNKWCLIIWISKLLPTSVSYYSLSNIGSHHCFDRWGNCASWNGSYAELRGEERWKRRWDEWLHESVVDFKAAVVNCGQVCYNESTRCWVNQNRQSEILRYIPTNSSFGTYFTIGSVNTHPTNPKRSFGWLQTPRSSNGEKSMLTLPTNLNPYYCNYQTVSGRNGVKSFIITKENWLPLFVWTNFQGTCIVITKRNSDRRHYR